MLFLLPETVSAGYCSLGRILLFLQVSDSSERLSLQSHHLSVCNFPIRALCLFSLKLLSWLVMMHVFTGSLPFSPDRKYTTKSLFIHCFSSSTQHMVGCQKKKKKVDWMGQCWSQKILLQSLLQFSQKRLGNSFAFFPLGKLGEQRVELAKEGIDTSIKTFIVVQEKYQEAKLTLLCPDMPAPTSHLANISHSAWLY